MADNGDGTGKTPAAVAMVLAPRKLCAFAVSIAVTPRIRGKKGGSA
jgi:hypothetical protein